ncbi:hypothetical protein N9J72_00850 [Candidatus Gracilibacteria bacterium]|nr:hypothetical protein [Candidatus Gracilibacteria bacterium]
MNEYLQNLYTALRDKDFDRLQEIGGFYSNDDQYDYETHDVREINLTVASYVNDRHESDREKALILIDEFDTENKIDEIRTT